MKELLKNQIQKEGNYKMFPQYLLALPPKESVMLMYLIDQEAYIEQRLADEPEYFRCCQENYIKNYFIAPMNGRYSFFPVALLRVISIASADFTK